MHALFNRLRHAVFWPPFLLLVVCCVWSLADFNHFLAAASTLNSWILQNFGGLYSAGSLFFLVTCLAIYISPLGKVRIGGAHAKPLMSKWQWFSITICTTIAIGILFWGTAEPLMHLHNPPAFTGLEADSGGSPCFCTVHPFSALEFYPLRHVWTGFGGVCVDVLQPKATF